MAKEASMRLTTLADNFLDPLSGFRLATGIILGAIVATNIGCSSTNSTSARPLEGNTIQRPDLGKFDIATVVGFEVTPGKNIDPAYGDKFAADIFRRLKHDFGPIFKEVRFGDPLGAPNEIIIGGVIKNYSEMGTAGFLFQGLPLDKANLDAEVILRDGATKQSVFDASIDKLWGLEEWSWGAKTADRKGLEAGAAVANTIARARGWKPKD
jgi:hypothetical protein